MVKFSWSWSKTNKQLLKTQYNGITWVNNFASNQHYDQSNKTQNLGGISKTNQEAQIQITKQILERRIKLMG